MRISDVSSDVCSPDLRPGMSAALRRLRQLFGDDLLVKQGSEMQPTARALALEPELRRLLREVERLVADPEAFTPADSRRSFTIRISDLLSLLILPSVAGRLSRSAPGVALGTVHLSPEATPTPLEPSRITLPDSSTDNRRVGQEWV